MDPFIGQIILFAGNFAPRNWAFCDGQLLAISQNTALFSILGTTYGGDGRTTFALPDLRGRVPMHAGSGPGLTPRPLGQKGGAERHTLTITEIPSHDHNAQLDLFGSNDPASSAAPEGNVMATSSQSGIYGPANNLVPMDGSASQVSVAANGGSQPHNNVQPYTALNYIIALYGLYPSRN